MIKGDFEFKKVSSDCYTVTHLPSGRNLGSIVRGYRGWDAVPMTPHYGGHDSRMEAVAQAMLNEINDFGEIAEVATGEDLECPYRETYGCKMCSDEDCPID